MCATCGGCCRGAAAKPPEVPATFLVAENGDKEKARARWEKTLQWRKENDVDATLEVSSDSLGSV